jgi:hypothetical protein
MTTARAALILAAALLPNLHPPAGLQARQADAAVVQEKAFVPERVRTRNSRGQLGFPGGAAGRLNTRGTSDILTLLEAGRPALGAFLQRRFPGAFPATAREAPGSDPLVERINRIREQSGRPALQPLPAALAAENAAYLAPVLQGLLESTGCDHDRSRWEAFKNRMASTATLTPTSEVIACPMPAAAWNPERVVSRWMGSPLHRQILIHRPRARAIGCVRLVRSGRAAAICTLWSPAAA